MLGRPPLPAEWLLDQIDRLQRDFDDSRSNSVMWQIHVWRRIWERRPKDFAAVIAALDDLADGRSSLPRGQRPINPDPAGTAADLLKTHRDTLTRLADESR